jgi:periplasmic protein TonB
MPIPNPQSRRSLSFSILLHGLALTALLVAYRLHPIVIINPKLPGTATGTHIALSFQPGGSPSPATRATAIPHPSNIPSVLKSPTPTHQPDKPSTTPNNLSGAGAAGEASQGDGDISIALVQFHPSPTPDLSTLPYGTTGDVILDAVIDDHGHIAKLTLAHGLGSPIDDSVIATVQQWTFTPATRNGIPTASEQEILFHYEHS